MQSSSFALAENQDFLCDSAGFSLLIVPQIELSDRKLMFK